MGPNKSAPVYTSNAQHRIIPFKDKAPFFPKCCSFKREKLCLCLPMAACDHVWLWLHVSDEASLVPTRQDGQLPAQGSARLNSAQRTWWCAEEMAASCSLPSAPLWSVFYSFSPYKLPCCLIPCSCRHNSQPSCTLLARTLCLADTFPCSTLIFLISWWLVATTLTDGSSSRRYLLILPLCICSTSKLLNWDPFLCSLTVLFPVFIITNV